ncbi:DUF4238 domain-containing protein [Lachnospiraceae bacterium SGI.054]
MAKEQKPTADQHYVPRCYLKNFGLQVGKPNKPKYLIGFYQFDKQLLKAPICSIESVCYKDFYYGEDGVVEKQLCHKERVWSVTIQSAINAAYGGKPLSQAEKDNLKEFALYQYSRTTAMVNYTTAQNADMMTNLCLMKYPKYEKDKDTIWKLCKEKVEGEIPPASYVKIADSLLDIIEDLKVSLVRFDTPVKLITSDAPVVNLNPYTMLHNAGFGTIGAIIVFPIHPAIAVLIYDGKMYSKVADVVYGNEKDVEALNRYQYITAEDRVLSIHPDIMERLAKDIELNNARENFRDKAKLSQMPSESTKHGDSVLIAFHGRFINYIFPLSFIKLPREIRKISLDCRDALMRIDEDGGWRYRLLMLAYGMSTVERLGGIPEAEIKKRRTEYRKLLRYMDDYWQIPINERTITPQMMARLQLQSGKLIRKEALRY